MFWNVRASPLRQISWAGAWVISVPPTEIVPLVTGSIPVIMLTIVVLPAPLGPIRPMILPAGTSMFTLSDATTPPKRLDRLVSLSMLMRQPLPAP